MMRDKQRKQVVFLVAVLALVMLTACGSDDGEPEVEAPAPEDVTWEYIPIPSAVTSVDCTSYESAALSATEAAPSEMLTLSFDCVADVAELSVLVGESQVFAQQISPTVIGFALPAGLSLGTQTIWVSGATDSVEFSVSVVPGAESPADPKAYLNETISAQRALAEQIVDPEIRRYTLYMLDEAEAAVETSTPEEARQAADIIVANMEGLGLVPKDTCAISTSTAEAWWLCFRGEITANLGITLKSVLAFLAGKTLVSAGSIFGPVSVVTGVIIAGVGAGSAFYHLADIADELLLLTFRVIQVVGSNTLDVLFQRSTAVESGQTFTLSANAEYVTFSGASLGPDAATLNTFRGVIHKTQDLISQVNAKIGSSLTTYSSEESPGYETQIVDAEYLSVGLADDSPPEVVGDINGTDIKLNLEGADPVPVSLIVTYDFPGVRTVETTVDVVVQPRNPQIHVKASHSCLLKAEGGITCWGQNWANDVVDDPVAPSGTFTQLSLGAFYGCGIQSDGVLRCWGNRFEGTLPAGPFIQVDVGSYHSCGVRVDGTIVCWWMDDELDFSLTAPAGTYTQVSASGRHTCGIKVDGSVVCWGDNEFGEGTPPSEQFTQISVGAYHACGVTLDGNVVCWGLSENGQSTPPTGLFTQVSSGDAHSCGVKTDGSVACWGYNISGQASPPAGEFIQVSAGGLHSCGVRTDGKVICWGDNQYGQSTPPEGF